MKSLADFPGRFAAKRGESRQLERLARFCGTDMQRIGLSATVGNPETILEWAAGSSKREGQVVSPPQPPRDASIVIDWVASHENAAAIIAQLHQGAKRLVFADSRRWVEHIGRELRDRGVDAYVNHSSLSIDERQLAERAFAAGRDCVIVSTSALELGIDIGDLDHVVQVDAPTTVSSFLQRLGRSGRRPGTTSNCTFLCTEDEHLIRAAALVELYQRQYVENLSLRTACAHLLAHQILALSIQERGIPESDWWAWISAATPFRDLTDADRQALLDHMLSQEILARQDGRLALGRVGERLYGFKNFSELYAVFETPRQMTVLWGVTEIGTVDTLFVESQDIGRLTFTLGAKTWRAMSVDWHDGIIHAEPVPDAQLAYWTGSGKVYGFELSQEMRRVLTGSFMNPCWSRRAQEHIAQVRAEFEFLAPEGLSIQQSGKNYLVWTFAGLKANNALAAALENLLRCKAQADNLVITLHGLDSRSALDAGLTVLRDTGRPNEKDAARAVANGVRGRISKFQLCLPPNLETQYLIGLVGDPGAGHMALTNKNESGKVL